MVSRFADATILIVNAGETTRNQLHLSLAALEQASAPITGLVLNRASSGDRYGGYGYGYGYGYDYSAAPKASKRQRSGGATRLPADDEGTPISVP